MNVIWTRSARSDRFGILEYIAEYDSDAASRLNNRIREALGRLVNFPNLGKLGRVSGTREFVFHPNYIVVYRLEGDTLVVVNVLHAAQKYP